MARQGKLVDGFFGVPGDARLVVSVGPDDGTVYGSGLWYQTGSVPDSFIPDLDLVPGPWKAKLASQTIHVLELEVRFLSAATATVSAAIAQAGSTSPLDEITWSWKVASGKKLLKLYVITKA